MKKTISILGSVLLLGVLAGCANTTSPANPSVNQQNQQAGKNENKPPEVKTLDPNDSYLANALLTSEDLKINPMLMNARPSITQLNGKLDETHTDYDFFVVKTWYDRQEETDRLDDAITKFPTVDAAKQRVVDQAKGYEEIPITTKVGDSQIAYLMPGAEKTDPQSVVYRYSQGKFGVKIALYIPKNQGLTTEFKASLAEQAAQLAKLQYQRLDDLLNKKIPLSTNAAVSKLPKEITGAKLMGTVTVSDQEWLGIENEFKQDSIPGFVSGGLSRFSIDARSKEVVDVTVMEFKTAEDAKKFESELVPFAKKQKGKVLSLAKSLTDKNADAVAEPFGIVELQAAPGNFLLDVSISAPFDQTNMEEAEKDIKTMSEEILSKF